MTSSDADQTPKERTGQVFTNLDLKRLKESEYIHIADRGRRIVFNHMKLLALLARLEASEQTIEEYRDKLADMHESKGCLFNHPKMKPEDCECMACYAFYFNNDAYDAWRKMAGK